MLNMLIKEFFPVVVASIIGGVLVGSFGFVSAALVVVFLFILLYLAKGIFIDRNSLSFLLKRFIPGSAQRNTEASKRSLPTFASLVGGHFAARGIFSGVILAIAAWFIGRSDAHYLSALGWTAGVLALLSLAAFADAALITLRLRGGQYGLSALEVKEIGSFVIGHGGKGIGPQSFNGVFGRHDADQIAGEVSDVVAGVRQ